MIDNKTIGLLMSCNGSSYGMNLQAFATQYMIEKLGYDTEIIQFKSGSSFKGLTFDLSLFIVVPQLIINRFFSKRKIDNARFIDDIHLENNQVRIEAAKKFRDNRLHHFTKEMAFGELKEYSQKYAAVLIGSDQGWLPGFSLGRRNSLRFVPDGVIRLSYATSLGVSSYPRYLYRSSRAVWKSFDHISVREEEGRNIVKKICGEDFPVEVVVDPTYLITKEEWESLIPCEKQETDKYVLSFILGNNVEYQRCVRNFADFKKIKLISILSNESSSAIDMTYPDRVVIGASPEQFINLIRGAEYVFTDSFHGIAFSVINKVQFFVFYRRRAEDKNKYSRNSRIDNILRMWNIRERLIQEPTLDWNSESFKTIDYNKVHEIVERERIRSLEYLRQSLP